MGVGLAAMHFALLKEVNTGALEGDGARTAVAMLIAAGVPESRASAAVDDAASAVTEKTAADG